VCDEIDQLVDASTLLYELARASERLHHGRDSRRDEVSTDDTFRQTLSPTATDILIETETSVSPSDAAELRTIL